MSSSTRMRSSSRTSNGPRVTISQLANYLTRSIGQANRLRTHHTPGSGPVSKLQDSPIESVLATIFIIAVALDLFTAPRIRSILYSF